MNVHKVSAMIGERELSIEVGKLAKQADGAAVVRYGDTVVLVTACSAKEPRAGLDFFPLTCDYRENFYAAGKMRSYCTVVNLLVLFVQKNIAVLCLMTSSAYLKQEK